MGGVARRGVGQKGRCGAGAGAGAARCLEEASSTLVTTYYSLLTTYYSLLTTYYLH